MIVTSPNQREICHPPLGGDRVVFLRENLWYGDDDPVQWPQPFSETYPHYACIPACPDVADHPYMILWLSCNPRDYVRQSGPFAGLWMLNRTTFRALSTVATEVLGWATKPSLQNRTLICFWVPHIRHLLQRLEHIPTTLWHVQLGVRELQRYLLELMGAVDWYEMFEPRRVMACPTWGKDPARALGAFTDNPNTCEQLFRIGLPVWFVRPWDELPTIRIQNTVTVISYQDFYPQEPASSPTHKAVFRGAANDLRKYVSIYNYSRSCFRYPDPFGRVRAPGPALATPAVVTHADQALKRETKRQLYSPCMFQLFIEEYSRQYANSCSKQEGKRPSQTSRGKEQVPRPRSPNLSPSNSTVVSCPPQRPTRPCPL